MSVSRTPSVTELTLTSSQVKNLDVTKVALFG